MKQIHHLCIQTTDYTASKTFYEHLGFELVQESPDFHSRAFNSWLKLGDFYIELQTNKVDETLTSYTKHTAGPVHFALYVDDLQAEVARLEQLGIPFLPKHGGNIYFVVDGHLSKLKAPEGTIIELRDTWTIKE
ncbi:Glyoxalase/bleomycin resistance protein/dioxygenase [Exiguobacterium sibiricum 255-15]|uniref:Glyoxalase/bleomycin resistance protein/dioxygenase n=1 Tax=Exiguobacterium sibiricum (strain DSM 17290 / CCUG 55495 / CIP 109462 / JCM 13490 / 255-15) TaxID=262543 RepID=B1YGG3_EXIS2|nr:VOC family protein [Exiguobacterium sibiricum]ACB60967.1 Glyoxalase/bleomycin resistance protein/dioxygenase [Exiguobacterium sibiricum 255-15]